MKKRYRGHFASLTDIGRVRKNNEDQAAALMNEKGDILLVVCDGMGGHGAGEIASSLAISTLTKSFQNTPSFLLGTHWMRKTVRKANALIYSQGAKEHPGMGTTLIAALIKGKKLILCNLGDSRCYAYRDKLMLLSVDQTYVQYLENTEQIEHEEAASHPERHVLMNALGTFPSAAMDVKVLPYKGETILLCSDGLYNNMTESSIEAILRADDFTHQKVRFLVDEANDHGGSDNIGIALWEAIHD